MVNLGALSIPFIFSFHPRLRFDKQWKWALPAIFMVALFFILWDELFASIGVWGFNDRYITGHRILDLPLEEIAFFFCIPYACLFTYHCFDLFFRNKFQGPPARIHIMIPLICILLLMFGWGGWYTVVTAVLLLIYYLFHQFIWRSVYLNLFLFTYMVLLIPFMMTNGILTGTGIEEEVVWYDPAHIIGQRLITIPVEDVCYGLMMILGSVTLFEKLRNHSRSRVDSPHKTI